MEYTCIYSLQLSIHLNLLSDFCGIFSRIKNIKIQGNDETSHGFEDYGLQRLAMPLINPWNWKQDLTNMVLSTCIRLRFWYVFFDEISHPQLITLSDKEMFISMVTYGCVRYRTLDIKIIELSVSFRSLYGWCHHVVKLTNRFHVAVRLYSNRSQMTSSVIDHILTSSVIYYWTDPRLRGIYLFYIIKN